jgi:hypothetical protein
MTSVSSGRRRLLRAGLAGTLFSPLPWAWVWAQSEGALKLMKAPKVALVIGNAKYAHVPVLANPANDAAAVGKLLGASGFEVTVRLDAGREALVGAIGDYVRAMEKSKAVGIFYFAGHGVQLAWRNYLLPVDVRIEGIGDVARYGVDLARLMEGLRGARNAMNVVILDACRDNPFGNDLPVEQKGLSQMDAPRQTLLAYATSPGNVASDGLGVNGLYTEHLLREAKVEGAKIEDVFKRVRLGVRRTTHGAQIPWESTSLEEDFWLLPPKEPGKQSEGERDRQFREEMAIWERIREATEREPLEDYLQRFPSGLFCENAQLRLNMVLAKQGERPAQVASQQGNPYTKGTAGANTDFRIGDSYTYRKLDLYSGKEEPTHMRRTVTGITESSVTYDDGTVTDRLGNVLSTRRGGRFTPRQQYPVEYAVGRRWQTRFESTNPQGRTGTSVLDLHIAAQEVVTVPAGTFVAFRIEGEGYTIGLPIGTIELRPKWWMAPGQVRQYIIAEDHRIGPRQRSIAASRQELVSFSQA